MTVSDSALDTKVINTENFEGTQMAKVNSLGRELTDSEMKEISEARKNLNIADTNSIIVFGSASQAPLAKLADSMLDSVKARDSGAVGEQLGAMVAAMKSIDLDALGSEKKKGWISRMFNKVNPIEKFNERFDSVADLVTKTEVELNQHAMEIMRDNNFLDRQKQAARESLHSLEVNILALDSEIDDFKVHVDSLKSTFDKTQDFIDAQNVNDANDILDRLEQRRNDLMLTRHVVATLFSKNSIIKTTNITLLGKIQNQIVNGLPLWKSEISQRIMNGNRIAAAGALKESTDFTNELFKQSAKDLRISNRLVREEANRGVIDIETVKTITENLIGVMTDTIEIVNKGRNERIEVEKELEQDAMKLKNALITKTKEAANSTISTNPTTKNAFLDYKK